MGGGENAGWEGEAGECEGVGDGRCEQGGERERGTLASATALDRTPRLFSSSPSSLASVLGPLGSFSGSLAGSLQRSLGSWAIVAASSVLFVSWLLVLLLAPLVWLTSAVSVAMVPRQILTKWIGRESIEKQRPVQPRRGPARSC